jgi:hypothetical protein
MSCSTKGDCSSRKGGYSSKSPSTNSAFRRLSAGSVIRGDRGSQDLGNILESYGNEAGCARVSWARSLESLEGVVSAIQETTDVVNMVRSAFEEVSQENASAACAQPRQLDSFSETSGTWCWPRGQDGQHPDPVGRRDARGVIRTSGRLLG